MSDLWDLGGDLVGGADAGAGACSGARAEGAAATSSANDFEVCSHLGSSLLSGSSGILILRSITPDGGLLFAEKRNITGRLRGATPRAAGDGTSQISCGGVAVGGGGRYARGGAKGIHRRGAAVVLRVDARLGEVGVVVLHGEDAGRGCP